MKIAKGNKEALKGVATALLSIANQEDMEAFLAEILTPAEVRDVTLRWRLMKQLVAGKTQRRIAEDLGISLCKITRGSRILKKPGSMAARLVREWHAEEGQQ